MASASVIGAGTAGLLAANLLRNRGDLVSVHESALSLPNNKPAVFRFRSSAVSDALGIPFRKVRVIKSSEPYLNPIADAISYSIKTNGTATLRSSIAATGELVERFVSPDNFLQTMESRVKQSIIYALKADADWLRKRSEGFFNGLISTIPMPSLMVLLGYPDATAKPSDFNFSSIRGVVIDAELKNTDVFATMYFPDPALRFSRATITGSRLSIEIYPNFALSASIAIEPELDVEWIDADAVSTIGTVCKFFGIPTSWVTSHKVRQQHYAKILPIDDRERKRFIMWATDNFGIYSFGRFATWRPGLQMDDLVNDFNVIKSLIDGGTRYDHSK